MRQALLLFVVLIALSAAWAQSQSGMPQPSTAQAVGTWDLNLQKSDWGSIPPPKAATINVEQYDGRHMKWTATETDASGKSISESWQGALDGTPVAAMGGMTEASYAFQPTEDGMQATTTFSDGSQITSIGAISPDGQNLILKRHMKSPTQGEASWTEVYDRAR